MISNAFCTPGLGRAVRTAAQTTVRLTRQEAAHVPTSVFRPPRVGGVGNTGGLGKNGAINAATKAGGRFTGLARGLARGPLNGGTTLRQFGSKVAGLGAEAETNLMGKSAQAKQTLKVFDKLKSKVADPKVTEIINSASNLSAGQKRSMISVARFMVGKTLSMAVKAFGFAYIGLMVGGVINALIHQDMSYGLSPIGTMIIFAHLVYPAVRDRVKHFQGMVEDWGNSMIERGILIHDQQIEQFKQSWNITEESIQVFKNIYEVKIKEPFEDMFEVLEDYKDTVRWIAEQGADISALYIPTEGLSPDYPTEDYTDPFSGVSMERIGETGNDGMSSMTENFAKLASAAFAGKSTTAAPVNVPASISDIAKRMQEKYGTDSGATAFASPKEELQHLHKKLQSLQRTGSTENNPSISVSEEID